MESQNGRSSDPGPSRETQTETRVAGGKGGARSEGMTPQAMLCSQVVVGSSTDSAPHGRLARCLGAAGESSLQVVFDLFGGSNGKSGPPFNPKSGSRKIDPTKSP